EKAWQRAVTRGRRHICRKRVEIPYWPQFLTQPRQTSYRASTRTADRRPILPAPQHLARVSEEADLGVFPPVEGRSGFPHAATGLHGSERAYHRFAESWCTAVEAVDPKAKGHSARVGL